MVKPTLEITRKTESDSPHHIQNECYTIVGVTSDAGSLEEEVVIAALGVLKNSRKDPMMNWTFHQDPNIKQSVPSQPSLGSGMKSTSILRLGLLPRIHVLNAGNTKD